MIEFRTESEHGLRELQEEFNTLEASHQDEVIRLETDYHTRLDDLVKRHENEVSFRVEVIYSVYIMAGNSQNNLY